MGSEKIWYYREFDQTVGPVSQAELAQLVEVGRLKPDTLVFRQGLSDWARLSTALEPGGNALTTSIPPPPPAPAPRAGGVPFSALWRVFYDPSVFVDAYLSRGAGLLFLAFLAFVGSALSTITMGMAWGKMYRELSPQIDGITQVEVQGGKVHFSPARMKFHLDDDLILVDTSREHPPEDLANARVFIARSSTAMMKNSAEKRTFSHDGLDDDVFTPDDLKGMAFVFSTAFLLIVAPILFVVTFFWRLGLAALGAGVVLAGLSFKQVPADLAIAMRISAVALAFPVVCAWIVHLFGASGWLWMAAFPMIFVAALGMAVASIKL